MCTIIRNNIEINEYNALKCVLIYNLSALLSGIRWLNTQKSKLLVK